VLENYQIVTMQNMINRYISRLVGGNPESIDRYELEDIANFCLLIESCLRNLFEESFQLDLVT